MAETYNGAYVDQSRTILASTAVTATSTGTTAVYIPAIKSGLVAVLDVTAAGTLVGDTLDVYLQTEVNSSWYDVIRFTQVLGNGGAKKFVHKIIGEAATVEYETGTGLAAAADRDLFGDSWRTRYVVTNGGGTHAFTFSVVVCTF
jgi:hypothetical protein